MTYWQFHLAFTLPPLLLLLALTRRRMGAARWKWLAVVCAVAFLATAPWDLWAVHRRIWDFAWERVTPINLPLARGEWRLPAEEYAFFVFETLIVGLLTTFFLPPRGRAR